RDAMEDLLAYHWPGNLRELRNSIERAMVLCDGPEILPEHLTLEKMKQLPEDTGVLRTPPAAGDLDALPPLGDQEKEAERRRIVDALSACAFNQTRAAS